MTEGEPLAGLRGGPGARALGARRRWRGWPTPSTAIPRGALTLVGITGTNGKTTTSYLVEALLRARRARAPASSAPSSTCWATRRAPASQTTPEALELAGAAGARCAPRGVGGVAMEVSSHALALSRVDGIEFDVAVFTNLTQDHLDFHGTLDAYRGAKRAALRAAGRLAEAAARPRWSTPTIRPGAAMVARPRPCRCCTFGLRRRRAACAPSSTPPALDGIRMTVETPRGPPDARARRWSASTT